VAPNTYDLAFIVFTVVLRKEMEDVKSTMEKEHQRVADELNMEVDKKLKMEDHQVHGWSFRLSRNVRALCSMVIRATWIRSRKFALYDHKPDL
jgi:hypothetical protein